MGFRSKSICLVRRTEGQDRHRDIIQSFANKETEPIWNGTRSCKLPPDIQKRAYGRLRFIEAKRALNGSLDRIVPRAA